MEAVHVHVAKTVDETLHVHGTWHTVGSAAVEVGLVGRHGWAERVLVLVVGECRVERLRTWLETGVSVVVIDHLV